MTDPISDKSMKEAIDRIARTPDGAGLYLYCQRKLMTVCQDADLGALPRQEGARVFALELINLMAKGILESGGRTSSSPAGTEQPLVFAAAEPVTVRAPRGAGRRIGPDTRVPGYDPPTGD